MAVIAHNRLDLVGQQFGRLTVTGLATGHGSSGELLWNCLCSCGQSIVRNTNKLRTGHTKSCGCNKFRRGLNSPITKTRPILERLAERSYTDLITGCTIWTGAKGGPLGHGHIRILGRVTLVHRASWIAQRGSIPDGLDCLHDCPGGDNPACWNVDHLWLGDQADNNADRDRKGRHVALLGDDHGMSQVTTAQVLAMRKDSRPYWKIAEEFGLSEAHVGAIMRGDAWSHLPGAQKRR